MGSINRSNSLKYNGSTDNSLSVLKQFSDCIDRLRVIKVDSNQGYGHGILKGLEEANGEILSWTHADLQTDPRDILDGLKLFPKKYLLSFSIDLFD